MWQRCLRAKKDEQSRCRPTGTSERSLWFLEQSCKPCHFASYVFCTNTVPRYQAMQSTVRDLPEMSRIRGLLLGSASSLRRVNVQTTHNLMSSRAYLYKLTYFLINSLSWLGLTRDGTNAFRSKDQFGPVKAVFHNSIWVGFHISSSNSERAQGMLTTKSLTRQEFHFPFVPVLIGKLL